LEAEDAEIGDVGGENDGVAKKRFKTVRNILSNLLDLLRV